VILSGPESYFRGSGSFVLRGRGGSRKLAVALLGVHTPSKNPRLVSRLQAYIAYLLSGFIFECALLLGSENVARNVCRNALETVVL
jgi:hypothetical protein